jgi:hypothetical protein
MNGQAIKQDIYILRATPALAEFDPTDDHFNDKHSVIWFFDDLFTEVKIYLQKKTGGAFADVTELTDNTYGTFYPLAFFTNKFSERAIGYLIDWSLVLNEEGAGSYRVRVEGIKSIGVFDDKYSFEFALKVYTADRADRTVRIQWNRNGVLGSRFKDAEIEDYGILNWFNQIRVPNSMFGFDASEVTVEYIKYPNGSNVWLGDMQTEELTWNIYRLPNYIHRFIQVDALQSGKITFTDYNKLAPTQNIDRECVLVSGYKPEWIVGTINANVSVTLKPYYENLTHKRE